MTDQHRQVAAASATWRVHRRWCSSVSRTARMSARPRCSKLAHDQVVARGEPLAGVRVVFISVDGERDSPARAEGISRSAFPAEFVGLTAPADQVRNLALSFSAPFFKDPPKDGAYAGAALEPRCSRSTSRGRLRAELYDASAEATVGRRARAAGRVTRGQKKAAPEGAA